MLKLKFTLQLVAVFAVTTALAYAFGFYTLFAHTALEAVYWGALYFGSTLLGMSLLNLKFSNNAQPQTVVKV